MSAPGRLLLVAPDAADRAANRAFVALVAALVARTGAADVRVLVLGGGPLVAELREVAPTTVASELRHRDVGAVVERAVGRAGLRGAAAKVRGRRLGLAGLGPGDAVYLHDVLAVQVLRYLPAGVPVLCRVAEAAHPLHQPLSAVDLDLLLGRVDRFLAVTDAGVDELERTRGVDPRRIRRAREVLVAPAPTDPAEVAALRSRLDLPEGALVAGVFGAAAVEIHAPCAPLAVAVRRRPDAADVVLLLVVPEHMTDPWALHDIDHAGLAERVRVLALEGEAPPYVALCDLVVHAGWGSDHPRAYLEAAAAGVPIVCFDGHELAEVVGADEGGVVCPRLDLPALAAGVGALAGSPERRAAAGDAAATRALRLHRPEDAAALLVDECRAVGR